MWASRDAERYRNHYPDLRKDARLSASQKERLSANLRFYTNQLASQPDGGLVDVIHETWFGKYDRLEFHHGFIQWLFPIREDGLNHRSQRLQLHEMEFMSKDPQCRARLVRSYELMLDFYGFQLADKRTGRVEKARNARHRFRNLNSSFHNYLRITRILKSLGELGFEHFQAPFVEAILQAFADGQLLNAFRSCENYWIPVLRNDRERQRLAKVCAKLSRQSAPKAKPRRASPWSAAVVAYESSSSSEEETENVSSSAAAAAAVGDAAGAALLASADLAAAVPAVASAQPSSEGAGAAQESSDLAFGDDKDPVDAVLEAARAEAAVAAAGPVGPLPSKLAESDTESEDDATPVEKV